MPGEKKRGAESLVNADVVDQQQAKKQRLDNPNTKLDNLARVLEGSSACVAVCYVDKEILITNNELAKGTEKGANFVLIKNLMQYLQKKDGHKDRKTIFQEICLQRIKAEQGKISYKEADLERINTIANELLNDHHNWKEQTPNQVAKKFNLDIQKQPTLVKQVMDSYFILSRTAHDFKEVEKEFENNKELKEATINVLKDDNQTGVHAELRIINYLLSRKDTNGKIKPLEESYIGISKLCCTQCKSTIRAVNEVLSEEREKPSESDVNLPGRQEPKKIINYGDASNRDTHGMTFEKGWECPGFMNEVAIRNTVSGRSIRSGGRADEQSIQVKISRRYVILSQHVEKSLENTVDTYHSQHATPSNTTEEEKAKRSDSIRSESPSRAPHMTLKDFSVEDLLQEIRLKTGNALEAESKNIIRLVAEKELKEQGEDLVGKLNQVNLGLNEIAARKDGKIIKDDFLGELEKFGIPDITISSEIKQTSNHAEVIDAIKQSITESKEKITEESLGKIIDNKYNEFAAKESDKSQQRTL